MTPLRTSVDLLGWSGAATMAHLPATVAPIGRTRVGLPVGVQIIGPYLEDRPRSTSRAASPA